MLELIPISPALLLVAAPNEGRFPYAHSLLVRDGGLTALIDTGCGQRVLRALQAEVQIDLVICSHSHVDHTSGNWLFEGVPIWMPEGIGFETGGDRQKLAVRFVEDPALQRQWLAHTVPLTGFRDATLTNAYAPWHVFEFGATRLHTIPAPGHLSDHTCFWESESGTLLAVDIDFSRFGPWYGNPECDVDAFEQSIDRVRALSPRTVVSSHKGIYVSDLDAHFDAYVSHFARRDAAILAALQDPLSLAQLEDLAIIYGRFPRAEAMLRYFERVMLGQHLERLARRELVREVESGVWLAN